MMLVFHPIPARPGMYEAVLGERVVTRSRQPFYDGARVLLAEGVAPETVLEARHAASETVAMRSAAGEVARWTMEERDRGGLRRELWKPRPKALCSIDGAPENTLEGDTEGFGPARVLEPVPDRPVPVAEKAA